MSGCIGATEKEYETISEILDRFERLYPNSTVTRERLRSVIASVHVCPKGCQLNLRALRDASVEDFSADIQGFLAFSNNRGNLFGSFVPKCASRAARRRSSKDKKQKE